MHGFIVALAGVLALVGTASAAATAQELSPIGKWKLDAGESHYEISYCGPEAKRLCAKVIWLGPETLDKTTAPFLNRTIVTDGRNTAPNTWKGDVDAYGTTLAGTAEQVSADEIKITGCKFFWCKSFKLFRL